MKGSIDSPLPLSVKDLKPGVVQIGPLILQVMHVLIPWRTVKAFNYNMTFPTGVFSVWAQGVQMGDVGSNALYYAATAIQVASISNSQFKCVMSSDAQDAPLSAMVYALGY